MFAIKVDKKPPNLLFKIRVLVSWGQKHTSVKKNMGHMDPHHYLFHLVNSLCVVSMMNPGGAVDSVVMN